MSGLTARDVIALLYQPPEQRRHTHRCPLCDRLHTCTRISCTHLILETCETCAPDD
jgi:ribosomal protein L37AE/L43A